MAAQMRGEWRRTQAGAVFVCGTLLGGFLSRTACGQAESGPPSGDAYSTRTEAPGAPTWIVGTSADHSSAPLRLPASDAAVQGGAKGGASGAPETIVHCFSEAFTDGRAVIELVRYAHRSAVPRCLVARAATQELRAAPEPRDLCGEFTEELWNEAAHALSPILLAIRELTARQTPRNVFQNVDCAALSEPEFAAAAHFVSLAPRWADPEFVRCAVQREASAGEGFPLWSLLDTARAFEGSEEWVAAHAFADERTLRRIRSLHGERQQEGRGQP